ncbi:Protein kinase domain [Dillenia turbinata]|uniref:non-specific serine/threonine protein kinase n=1 Tax=Dillenia turbinata TaxID=194707 RepID=A0AAN8W081_9MAGN
MFSKVVMLVFYLATLAGSEHVNFIYNGFQSVNLILDDLAEITPNGLLKLVNKPKQQIAHAFFPYPINFKHSLNGTVFSFSTNFVFAMSEYPKLSSHGIAFVITSTQGLPGVLEGNYLGPFRDTSKGKPTNYFFVVELDPIQGGHVGININGIKSVVKNFSLFGQKEMQVWIEYDSVRKQTNVKLAPINTAKPEIPLLSLTNDLSSILKGSMHIGFSSWTVAVPTSHYVLGWSFRIEGHAQRLDLCQLPKLPPVGPKRKFLVLTIGAPMISVFLLVMMISGLVFLIGWRKKFAEVLEDWEREYGPHRFKYRTLYIATKGFSEKELLGSGGFGSVYRGILPDSKLEIAVKRVSHESRQGMKEFVAEVVSIGRLRHRNIVSLLGYCRRKRELLLVYDYMPHGSLDKYLYNHPRAVLNWKQRFQVIKGVASGLFYLHEGWEQVVIHRDIKASNVLLDADLHGRLGDFGLARLYDHGSDPQTTHVVGTFGYMAPEHARTGKATTKTDVFAFGAFLLEVACGKRPVEQQGDDFILVDWVFCCWKRGRILETADINLAGDYAAEEMELVLTLALLCSHADPSARPSMRKVVQILDGASALPDISFLSLSSNGLAFAHQKGFEDAIMLDASSNSDCKSTNPSSISNVILSGGR